MANIAGKVRINLSQRAVGRIRLLWNRLTPTRGARSVTNSLGNLSSNSDLKISVDSNGLKVQGELLASSGFYARCLYNAGVQEVEISEGRSQREIKKILNTLSDRGLEKAKGILENRHLKVEVERSMPPMPVKWSDFYHTEVFYRETLKEEIEIRIGVPAMFLGIVGGAIAGSFVDHAVWGGIGGGVFGGGLGVLLSLAYQRTLPGHSKFKLVAETSNFLLLSKRAKNWNPLVKMMVVLNVYTPQDVLEELAGDSNNLVRKEVAKSNRVSDAALSKLIDDFNKEIKSVAKENPRVVELMKSARETNSDKELSGLAKNPIWLVRKEVALSPYALEETLGELINEDRNEEVRKAVAENPKVKALVEQAENARSPEELTSLAKKPLPCVRAAVAGNEFTPEFVLEGLAGKYQRWMVRLAAAKNIRTPWRSVAIVLSKLRKDPYQITEEVLVKDHIDCIGSYHVENTTVTYYGYFNNSLAIAREILEIHVRNREKIMGRLKELNPGLYEALKKAKV
ncbi:MAG: hypothetical protein KKA31_03210 [Candidatus Margulisbacteria bacterium]|nr:hypothetical protein [Candidatus Margulisiibacteriota bacterium]